MQWNLVIELEKLRLALLDRVRPHFCVLSILKFLLRNALNSLLLLISVLKWANFHKLCNCTPPVKQHRLIFKYIETNGKNSCHQCRNFFENKQSLALIMCVERILDLDVKTWRCQKHYKKLSSNMVLSLANEHYYVEYCWGFLWTK